MRELKGNLIGIFRKTKLYSRVINTLTMRKIDEIISKYSANKTIYDNIPCVPERALMIGHYDISA